MSRAFTTGAVALAVVLVGGSIFSEAAKRVEQRRQVKALLASVDSLRAREDAQRHALEASFNQINIERYLKPAELSTADGVSAARGELARYRTLLAERDQVSAADVAEVHALLATLPPGETRDGALQGEASATARSRSVMGALSRTQLANADAVQAVLDWAEAHRADLKVRDGKLLTANQRELTEIRALGTRLSDSAQAVDEAVRAAKAMRRDGLQSLEQARQSADL